MRRFGWMPGDPRGERAFALSPLQEGLWFTHASEPANPTYNMSFAARVAPAVDFSALARAWSACCARHDQLRASFHGGASGQPFQRIADEAPAPSEIDATGWSEERLRAAAAEEHRRPFELAREAVRLRVYRTGDGGGVLLLTCHHIVCDVGSFDLLLRDLALLYGAERGDAAAALTPPPAGYREFVARQREWLEREGERALAFWRPLLAAAGGIEPLDVVRDRPGGAADSRWRSAIALFRVERELAEGLRRLSPNLFRTLLAAYALLLHAYRREIAAGAPRFAIGITADVRGDVFADVFGDFVNMLPIPVSAGEARTFRGLRERVEAALRAALEHRGYPFTELLRRLRIALPPGGSPVFQAAFTFHGSRRLRVPEAGGCFIYGAPWSARLGSLRLESFPIPQREALYEVQLRVGELHDGTLAGELHGDARCFDLATVEAMRDHFLEVLAAVARDPDAELAALAGARGRARERLLGDWNATTAAFPRDARVEDLFREQVQRDPDAVAVEFEGASTSYRELDRRSDRVACWLQDRGVGALDRVAVGVDRSERMVAAVLGVLKAGAAYVPVDPSHPEQRRALMRKDAEVRLELDEAALEQALAAGAPERRPERRGDAGSLAYLLYTSGSTGMPKGVMVPHRAVVNFVTAMRRLLAPAPADVLVAVTTLSFDMSVLELYLPLATGARIVVAGRDTARDPAALAALLDESGATLFQATPATWRMLVAAGWPGRPGLTLLCGAEPMTPDLLEALQARGRRVFNLYGPTETTVWSTGAELGPGAPVTIGRPIANTRVHLVDARLELVPQGAAGELCIAGEGVALGYWRRPELTAERFVADPFAGPGAGRLYRTGDVARWRPDGSLEFLGRLDRQVKIQGYRIEPGEVEAALLAVPGVAEAAVVAREDGPAGLRLVGYVVPRGRPPRLEELREALRLRLPRYMVPSAFALLDELPRTPNGKLDLARLPAPELRPAAEPADAPAPASLASGLEAAVAEVWKEVLAVPELRPDDNFFDLGGHSLLATRLVARVRERLGAELAVRTVFEAPTVAEFSGRVLDALVGTLPAAERRGG